MVTSGKSLAELAEHLTDAEVRRVDAGELRREAADVTCRRSAESDCWKRKPVLADLDLVAACSCGLVDPVAVDVGAVEAADVGDREDRARSRRNSACRRETVTSSRKMSLSGCRPAVVTSSSSRKRLRRRAALDDEQRAARRQRLDRRLVGGGQRRARPRLAGTRTRRLVSAAVSWVGSALARGRAGVRRPTVGISTMSRLVSTMASSVPPHIASEAEVQR